MSSILAAKRGYETYVQTEILCGAHSLTDQ